MPIQPTTMRAVSFFDGQNLFHSAKAAFGYTFPNYDPVALAKLVCANRGWDCAGTRFYTGIPDASDNALWKSFLDRQGRPDGARGGCRLYAVAALSQ